MRVMVRLTALMTAVGLSACATSAGDGGRIIVDGLYEDWSHVTVAIDDPVGDAAGAFADIGSVWITNDEEYVYVRFEINVEMNLQTIPGPVRVYFDVDQDASTGWPVGGIGSDFVFMYPERYGTEQKADDFNAAPLGHANLDHYSGPTYADDEFEMRFSRSTVLPIRGEPLFVGEGFDFLIEAQTRGQIATEFAPDAGTVYSYQMTDEPATPLEAIEIEPCSRSDLRVVTWNVLNNGLFSRTEIFDRVLSVLEPDVVLFQELNASRGQIAPVMNSILPLGDGAGWQVYSVGGRVICSKYPLSLQRGDTKPSTQRGQAMALIDLPDDRFDRDLYAISMHMKCCGSLGGSEDFRRQRQADANVNWFRDLRTDGGEETLPTGTPIVIAGDYNLVGGIQPLRTLLTGDIQDEKNYGPDSPPDWDGSDMLDVFPRHQAGPATYTWRSPGSSFAPGRLDFVLTTDSVVRVSKAFVFNTADLSAAELAMYGLKATDTEQASDHLPIVVDLLVGNAMLMADADGDEDVDLVDYSSFAGCVSGPVGSDGFEAPSEDCVSLFDMDMDGDVDLINLGGFQSAFGGGFCSVP